MKSQPNHLLKHMFSFIVMVNVHVAISMKRESCEVNFSIDKFFAQNKIFYIFKYVL